MKCVNKYEIESPSKDLGIKNTRLLSDFWPHGKVAQLYGIFREDDGISERANIVINEDQKISFVKIYPIAQLPDIHEILCFLETKKITGRILTNKKIHRFYTC